MVLLEMTTECPSSFLPSASSFTLALLMAQQWTGLTEASRDSCVHITQSRVPMPPTLHMDQDDPL